ncbi:MAG: S-layer homology domain-containing protein [Oscillospiraceae bacterium]
MKRTFGKILSFALVLAMVLSMVPAVLAAPKAGDAQYLALGETANLTCTGAKYWVSSNPSAVSVKKTATGSATITALSTTSSGWGYGTATISAYEKESDYTSTNYADRHDALMTWSVTVSEWKVTLSLSGSNSYYGSTSTDIPAGQYKTLTATVTGPQGKVKDAQVKFSVADADMIHFDDLSRTGTDIVKDVTVSGSNSSTATSGTTSVKLYGGSKGGYVTVTAKIIYNNDAVNEKNENATATVRPYVVGPEGWTVSLPDSQLAVTLKKGRNTNVLTPTLKTSSNSSAVSGTEFVYKFVTTEGGKEIESSTSTLMQIEPVTYNNTASANITAYSTCANVKVRVYVKGYETPGSPHADAMITVTDSTISSLQIGYKNSTTANKIADGSYVLGYKDSTDKDGVTLSDGRRIVTSPVLAATVTSSKSGNEAVDAARVVWTVNNPSVATFADGSTETTASEVTLKTTGAGTVKITAKGDDKTAEMTLTVWQAREYDNILTKPDIPSAVSDAKQAITKFCEQYASVELKNVYNGRASLKIQESTVQFVSNTSSAIKLKGTLDAFDTINKIAYFPATSGGDVITSSTASVSSIMLIEEPQDATYKLNAAVGTLTVKASIIGTGKTLKTFTWYDNNNKVVDTQTVTNSASTYTSTLNLADFVTSAGTYGFKCVITGGTDRVTETIETRTAIITIGGDYNVKITPSASSVKPGDTVTLNAVPQQYNPARKTYTDVTGKTYTVSWTVTEGSDVVTLNSRTGSSVTLIAKSGGTATITAETTIDGNKYTGTQKITVTVPAAEDVRLMLEEDATYVMLDGGKLSDAVKKATSTTPSTFSFTLPTTGTIYSSSSLSSSISAGNKYSASDVSRMAFKPSRSAGSYTIDYAAYGTSGQIATGKIVVMTNAGTVAYHISANESQTMQVSDFQSVYGSGLSSVKFGTASDSRGALYKGSSTSSGKVGSESYYVSTGTTLLKNVTFIAGSSTAKYSVVIPFTAYGSNGEANGNLVIYVNDTHSVYSTGATFKSMAIADELAPESNASSAYITITRVTGGKLYTQYSKINRCTALAAKDLGSTRFSFSGSNSIDNLYVLPLADSKTVEVNYTINGSDKGTLTFKVVQQTASSKFTDVSGSFKWAANSVDFMYGNGLVNGISTKNPNVFGPGQNMTRAMLVTILYRAAGEPSVAGITNKFTDNKQNQYYYEPVLWASSKGIVNGATATTFDPDGKITREQIAAILYRYAGSPAASSSALNGFADQSAVSSYAVTAMQWAVGNGIITGVSTNGRTTLSAKNNATRAQVSVMLHRFLTMEQ